MEQGRGREILRRCASRKACHAVQLQLLSCLISYNTRYMNNITNYFESEVKQNFHFKHIDF